MDLCIVAQLYLAMAVAHMDIPANHMKIAEAGNFLNAQCEVTKKKDAPKVGKADLESKHKLKE